MTATTYFFIGFFLYTGASIQVNGFFPGMLNVLAVFMLCVLSVKAALP